MFSTISQRELICRRKSLLMALFSIVATISFLSVLVAYAYIGSFSRYLADDYCTAGDVLSRGLIATQKIRYMNWSGRYSFTLVVGLVELIGLKIVPLLPALALLLWLIGLGWAILQIGLTTHLLHSRLVAFLLSTLILFATIDSTPDVVQSLYWQTGVLTYILPLICLTVYVGLIYHRLKSSLYSRVGLAILLLSAGLTFIAGGFSETYVALQTTALFLAIMTSIFLDIPVSFKRIANPLIVAGLVGSVLAMVVIIIAPGNSVRQSHFPPPPDFISIVGLSLWYAADFMKISIFRAPFTITLSLALPALLAFQLHLESGLYFKKIKRMMLLFSIAGFILRTRFKSYVK